MSELRSEFELPYEDIIRSVGTSMLEANEGSAGICLKGGLKDGVFLHLEVVRVKNGKIVNANV